MTWLEIIKIRPAGVRLEQFEELLLSLREAGEKGLVDSRIYIEADMESDVSLHLLWRSDRPDRKGSSLGLRLVQAFREFGLVDHSVWVEHSSE